MYSARYLTPQVNTQGLFTHIKLWEGTAFDYSLNGNNGTVSGTTTFYSYPGIDLAGADEFITVLDDAAFTPALTPFSISAWVYMHDATNFIITSKGVAGVLFEWEFKTDVADKLRTRFYDHDVDTYIGRIYDTTLVAYQNKWIHLFVTYDGGTLSAGVNLYLNGVRVDDTDYESGSFVAVENLAAPIYIGKYDTNYANGLIDDVMFFNRELSATDAKSIYSVMRQRYGV